jgi:hypothetical protein
MKINLIFKKLKKEYNDYDLILLNGGFIDLNGANKTTMMMILYDLNYLNFKFNRKNVKEIELNKNKRYKIIEFNYEFRKINIIITANNEIIKNKILIRNNEIMLNNFSLLVASVLILIELGNNSYKSWGLVLGLDIENENDFLIETKKLENIAKVKVDKLNKIILKSKKKIPEN